MQASSAHPFLPPNDMAVPGCCFGFLDALGGDSAKGAGTLTTFPIQASSSQTVCEDMLMDERVVAFLSFSDNAFFS